MRNPPGFGVRQSSGALAAARESARGLAHSKTLARLRKPWPLRKIAAGILWALTVLLTGCEEHPGTVVDYETRKPVAGAEIFHAGKSVRADQAGNFILNRFDKNQTLLVRAAGYRQGRFQASDRSRQEVTLEPFEARGIYLSYAVLGMPEARARAMELLDGHRLNTLVVDIKDSQGRMTFFNGAPSAGQAGAFGAVKISDIEGFIADLHRKKIYVVGRLAVFKDPVMAKYNPRWAIRCQGGPNRYWLDPFRKEVWAYDVSIAKEAAAVGFDEIQFDYVRFPENGELANAKYSGWDTQRSRQAAIDRFLALASRELTPLNVGLSLTLSPGDLWRHGRPEQKPITIAAGVDYVTAVIRDDSELKAATILARSEPKRLRTLIESKARPAADPEVVSKSLQAVVKACRDAGFSGWVISDAANQFNLPRESIKVLAAIDE